MLVLTIREVIRETADTITVLLNTHGIPFPYEAGQYVTLCVKIDGVPYYRSYSLASSPHTDAYPALTIKRVKDGKVSNYLNNQLAASQALELIPPQGSFTLIPQPHLSRDLLFLAGGSGITPLYAMIKTALAQEKKSRLSLIYASRSQEDIIYAQALESLAQSSQGRLHITHVLSAPTPTWSGLSGRLTSDRLSQLLDAQGLGPSSDYFLCAPQGLLDMAVTTLTHRQVPPAQIHTESFVAAAADPSAEAVTAQVVLRCDGDEETFQVAKGQTLLDAAFDQGIYTIPSSCMSGTCNTCQAKCLEGRVHMDTDEGLAEQDKKAGYILTCVAQPLTEKIVLELDES